MRIMNTYYSNSHSKRLTYTRPKDIERALGGDFDEDEDRRDLQREAPPMSRSGKKLIAWRRGTPPRTSLSGSLISRLHAQLSHHDAPEAMLLIKKPA